jgi:acyl carrier protein
MTEIAHQIASFVRHRFQVSERDPNFTYDAHLWEEGFIDSMGVVELLAFLQEQFDVDLPPDALFDEDCTTINGLARLVVSLSAIDPVLEPHQRRAS